MASESNVPKLKKSFERHVRPPPCERARSAHPRTGTVPTKPGQRPVSQRGSSGHIGTNTVCKETTPPHRACGRRLQSSPAKESLPPSPCGRGCGVPGTALRGTGRRGRRGAQPAAVACGGSSPRPGPQSPRQEDDSGAKRVVQRGAAPRGLQARCRPRVHTHLLLRGRLPSFAGSFSSFVKAEIPPPPGQHDRVC